MELKEFLASGTLISFGRDGDATSSFEEREEVAVLVEQAAREGKMVVAVLAVPLEREEDFFSEPKVGVVVGVGVGSGGSRCCWAFMITSISSSPSSSISMVEEGGSTVFEAVADAVTGVCISMR